MLCLTGSYNLKERDILVHKFLTNLVAKAGGTVNFPAITRQILRACFTKLYTGVTGAATKKVSGELTDAGKTINVR